MEVRMKKREPGRAAVFAYGSLLSIDYFRKFCPTAETVMRADIPNYELQFRDYWESWKGGTSCIVAAPGKIVRGVICNISRAELEALDVMEQVPQSVCVRHTFLVQGEDRKLHEAFLYLPGKMKDPVTPSKGYVDLMLKGAREQGLEPGYVSRLESLRRSLD
jgi:gamma-glutamylcyclotransferase (GGCT)/AIG2-like uncharacterized protein YtfP